MQLELAAHSQAGPLRRCLPRSSPLPSSRPARCTLALAPPDVAGSGVQAARTDTGRAPFRQLVIDSVLSPPRTRWPVVTAP